jgi:AcrR family transcriptional regulator
VIATKGLAATQISDVAELAGISSAGLLYHFGSRQALLSEALRFKDQRWLAEIDAAESPFGIDALIELLLNPRPKLKSAWRRDWIVWIEAVVTAFHDDAVRKSVRSQEARWTALIGKVLTNEFGHVEPEAAVALSSLVDGLSIRLLITPGDLTHEAAATIAREYAGGLTAAR